MLSFRAYDPRLHKTAVRGLLIELLDSEKAAEPEWPAGLEIIEPYFRWMMRRCRRYSGRIFVAEDEGRVIGFVAVLGRILPADPDEYKKEYALITDLVVSAPFRSRGIGRQLIGLAEQYARECGAGTVRLQASAGNRRGRRFYAEAGYRELVVELIKTLD
jgi:GNAT superfamily N-acetyltransferase